jgi:LacI family transcriptional regulator
MAISLKNIAERARVTKTTVSMALRDHPSISVARRKEVQDLAREMGYRPNPLARGLAGKSTRTIGIAWSLGRPTAGKIVQDLAIRLWNQGYVTIFANSLSDPAISRQILVDFAQRGVDGVLIQASHSLLKDPVTVRQLKGFKAVVAMTDEIESSPVDLVVQDTTHGVRQLMDYWLATGRRRIGFVGEEASNHEKIEPMRQKLREAGLPVDRLIAADLGTEPRLVNHFENYWSIMDRRYPRPEEPFPYDAVFCAAAGGAGGVLKWLQHRGLRLPEDVAVAGVENVDLAQATTPPLASLDRHSDALSESIEASLFHRLAHPKEAVRVHTVPSTFIWRESAGPCPTCLASAGKGMSCPLHANRSV